MIWTRLLTEDHNPVRGSKIETCATRQRRNEKYKYLILVLKPIDQRHAYVKINNRYCVVVTECARLTIFLLC